MLAAALSPGNDPIYIVESALAVVGALALAAAYFAASWGKNTRQILRENNEDLLRRVQILEEANTRLEAEVKQVTAENQSLREMVSGAKAIAELTSIVHRNHSQVMDAIRKAAQ